MVPVAASSARRDPDAIEVVGVVCGRAEHHGLPALKVHHAQGAGRLLAFGRLLRGPELENVP